MPWPPCARGYPTPQLRPPPPAPRVRPPPRRAHLLSRLQVPLQRLLRELPDAQLALLARHHYAGPAEAYGHFHPGPWRSRQAWPNRCLAPRVQPPLSGDSQHRRARKPGAPLPAPPLDPGLAAARLRPGQAVSRGRESGRERQGEDLIYLPGGRGARTRRQSVRAPPPAPAPASARARFEVADQSAPKRNCRPGPVLVLALALALAAAGSAPGPGLEWAAAAARGARVGRKLLRWSQLLRCAPRSGLPRPQAGLGPALKGAAALPGPAAHSAARGGGRAGR